MHFINGACMKTAVSTGGLMLAGAGWMSNLMVYLINTYHVQKIDAVQISTIILGFMNLFPVFAAIIADSFLSCFTVIWIFSFTSLLVCYTVILYLLQFIIPFYL